MKHNKLKGQHLKRKGSVPVVEVTVQKPVQSVKPVYAAIFLFIFSFLLYINTIPHDYALDDVAVIQQNRFTKQGIKGIPSMLTTFYWKGYWDTNAGLYRPLSLITFAIEYDFFPDNPHVCHFVNVMLYALNISFLFLILFRLFEKRKIFELQPGIFKHVEGYGIFWFPFLTVLLFAAHPVHTEVVANIKSRDELLCFLCFLGSFHFLLKYIENKKISLLFLSLILYFFSLFSKEGALVFLGVIPLTLYFFTQVKTKELVRLMIPFFIIAAIWYGIHSWVIASDPQPKITYSYLDNTLVSAPSYLSRQATAIYMMGKYIVLLFFPHPLSYDYSFSEIDPITFAHPKSFLSLLLCVALLFMAYWLLKRRHLVSFGIIFFFITMSMVSNIFMLIGATFADRLLFVPSLGFCIIVSYFLIRYLKISALPLTLNLGAGTIKLLSVAVLILLCSFKTVTRNMDWKNNFTLFSKDVNASMGSGRTHYNYGTEVMNRLAFKEKDEVKKKEHLMVAVKHLEISLQIDPRAANSYLNLATAYYNLKDYQKAKENAVSSIKFDPRDIKAYSVLGRSSYRVNDYALAIKNLLRVTKEKNTEGNQDEIYTYLGASYFALGKSDSALYYMNLAKEINPSNKEIYINLGSIYGSTGQFGKSIENFNQALKLDSTNRQVYYFLALTYKNMGDTVTAKKYLERSAR